ncbi:MAG: hypothetical protein A4S14_01045 [Proteobacteria bacterium SG_bin9]|nr:MAG: hypothetical protein A4S14_01045 [Proteobacteria bacterium SG_bin9]
MSVLHTHSMTNHHASFDLSQVGETLKTWLARYRQRRDLAQLSEHDLNDFGQSWSSVADEVSKPFWQA